MTASAMMTPATTRHGLCVVSALGEEEEHYGDEQKQQREDVALDPRLEAGGVPGGAGERSRIATITTGLSQCARFSER